jgi:hypothetical protein
MFATNVFFHAPDEARAGLISAFVAWARTVPNMARIRINVPDGQEYDGFVSEGSVLELEITDGVL